ncbi:MAG TPA: hypothetical protein VGP47_04445 [Parachlamydiaceae bacterium]|nr:hypothetical protein [Parachlamydiaceae bacterium]
MLFANTTQAEARYHCRSNVGLNVNVGTRSSDTYVTRHYARQVVVPTTVVVPQGYYTPHYAPVYYQSAPVYYQAAPVVPAYYEEVYVAPAPCRMGIGFGGLSFSWNFFR